LPVRFKKPPVVEAWIEFRFALTQENSVWDKNAAESLVRSRFGDFTPESFFHYVRVEADAQTGKPNFGTVQEFFDQIRAFSTERDRCVQAGRDVLVFNQLNKGEWPGYPPLCEAAIDAAAKYMAFRDLTELVVVALHYRDVVSLPRSPGSGIKIEDWFRVHPRIAEDDFGPVSSFKLSVQLPTLCKGAIATLSIRSLPLAGEDDPEFRFSIDWHARSADRMKDLTVAKQWLDSAHEALESSFHKALTRECLALFEPSEGE
jgi:uncharacterized protein (TIGR04255 family)